VYEVARRLGRRHHLTLVTLTPAGSGFAELEALQPQRPAVFEGFPYLRRPFGRFHPLVTVVGLTRLSRLYQTVAEYVDARADVLLSFPCRVTPAPLLLRHVKSPSVLFMGEPLRGYFEPTPLRPNSHDGRALGKPSAYLDRHDPLAGMQKRVTLRVDLVNARSARRLLAYSDYSKESLYRAYGIWARTTYPGVDTEVFAPNTGAQREHAVLSVGHLWPTKGHDLIVEAVGRVPDADRPELIIAGDLSNVQEKSYLMELASRRGVKVKFESSAKQADIVARYQRVKVVAFAPILEPFGFVPLEAMACETPVVGVREGGVRETIRDGEGGFLVERDADTFADKISRLISDEGLRRDQGAAGRHYVQERWTWDRTISQLERHLLETHLGQTDDP
jgi:glycosyltransferase involved in cell wall biosynthesis